MHVPMHLELLQDPKSYRYVNLSSRHPLRSLTHTTLVWQVLYIACIVRLLHAALQGLGQSLITSPADTDAQVAH